MKELDFEAQLRSIAEGMNYPRTPDIAGSVSARLRSTARPRFVARPFAWSVTILLILCSSLMLIPPARAAILEFIQIGVVRIFRSETAPPPEQIPSTMAPVTATPASTEVPLIPLLQDLMGETTLEEAQQAVTYSIRLPSYPADLGEPDHVFVQDAAGAMTILVWIDPQHPDQVLMSLHFLPPESWAVKKLEPIIIEETTVNGRRAIWTTGPYPMRLANGDIEYMRMINGHVLIWEEADVTYRIETQLSMEEAVKIAESLQPSTSP